RGLLDVSNAPFVAENSVARERTHLFSVQFAVRIFAGFFGYSLAGALPSWFASILHVPAESPGAYRAALLCGAGVFFVALYPLARLRNDSKVSEFDAGVESHRDARFPAATAASASKPRPPVRLLIRLFTPEIAIGLGAGALVPFLNVFFKAKFGVSDALLGVLYAGQSVAMGIAILLGPILAARLGRPRAVVATQLLSISFLILLGFTPFLAPAVIGFLMRASLMNMGHPLYSAFSMDEVGPRYRALASGLLVMTSQGSRALSSWASGILQEGPGFAPVFAITCACYFTASVMIFLFFIRGSRQRKARTS
nr:MFS transporter [Candidatus Bipolaricaulota bacterium]